MPLFKLIGGLILLYALYAFATGEVVVKSGMGGKRYKRDAAPVPYWSSVVFYVLLAIVVMTLF